MPGPPCVCTQDRALGGAPGEGEDDATARESGDGSPLTAATLPKRSLS